jgi:lysophospholipase L1-like esterase
MRSVRSFFLSVKARYPGSRLCFRAGILGIAILGILGCGSLLAARSSTLSVIADPASPHHEDYREYRQGHLTKAQLMDRLPHIAMIGDSLSRDFYVSSRLSMIWRAKMDHGHDWFLDTDPSAHSVYSLYERLAQETPVAACEYSSVAGRVDAGEPPKGIIRSCFTSWYPFSFSRQVDLILAEKRFPDLILIWMGHNNLHWVRQVDPQRPENIDTGLQKMAADFRKDYEWQLGRLVERAREQKQRRAFIVFGLVNFKSFFKARDAAEQLHKENPRLYPYLGADYQRFKSLRPEYRANMLKLDLMINEELRAMVDEFNRKLGPDSQVRLEYSDALATVDFSAVELINPNDGWHLSSKGHNVLAKAAFGALGPSLDFLGIVPLQKNATAR